MRNIFSSSSSNSHHTPEPKAPRFPVQKDHVVTIDYTVTDEDGEIVDTTRDRGVLSYLHGSEEIPRCFQEAMEDRYPGDKVSTDCEVSDAYGEPNDDLIREYDLPLFAGVEEIKEGMRFEVPTETGPKLVTVVEVNDNLIKVDENHPLAGKALGFNCTIVSVRPATDDELDTGSVIT